MNGVGRHGQALGGVVAFEGVGRRWAVVGMYWEAMGVEDVVSRPLAVCEKVSGTEKGLIRCCCNHWPGIENVLRSMR